MCLALSVGMVGLIAFAPPLTANSGNSRLVTVLGGSATFGTAFLIALVIAKMLALAFSQAAGFLGGFVFPLIFIGGTAGVVVNDIFPQIPIELAVGTLLASVAGAILAAPVSLHLDCSRHGSNRAYGIGSRLYFRCYCAYDAGNRTLLYRERKNPQDAAAWLMAEWMLR